MTFQYCTGQIKATKLPLSPSHSWTYPGDNKFGLPCGHRGDLTILSIWCEDVSIRKLKGMGIRSFIKSNIL